MAKVFVCKQTKAITVTMEQLAVVFSPLNYLQFESLPNCVLIVVIMTVNRVCASTQLLPVLWVKLKAVYSASWCRLV